MALLETALRRARGEPMRRRWSPQEGRSGTPPRRPRWSRPLLPAGPGPEADRTSGHCQPDSCHETKHRHEPNLSASFCGSKALRREDTLTTGPAGAIEIDLHTVTDFRGHYANPSEQRRCRVDRAVAALPTLDGPSRTSVRRLSR